MLTLPISQLILYPTSLSQGTEYESDGFAVEQELLFSVFQKHSTPSRFSLDLDLGGEIKRRSGESFDRSASAQK
jgi:hypothetical protein